LIFQYPCSVGKRIKQHLLLVALAS
jgi:hypothetical protein